MPNSLTASAPDLPATTSHSPVGRAEFLFLVVILLIFGEGLLPRLLSDESASDGSPILRFLWLPIYGVAFAGALWKAREIAQVCLRLPFLMLLLAVCALSVLWSIDPGLTARRSFAILMTTLAGLFIGTRYSWQTLLRGFAVAWLLVAIVSFLAAILVPAFGRMQDVHVGAWQGLYFEKNQLGGHMARAAIFAAFLAIMDGKYRWLWSGALILSTALVLLSTSKSSLLGLLVGLGILAVGAWMKQGVRVGLLTLWLGVIAAILTGAVFVFAPDLVFQLLGRDATLTGRTDIWFALADNIEERPWLGYGYGAFWAPESAPGNWLREALQWDAPTAHNGWLEVTVALGLIGLILLTLDFLLTTSRAVLAAVNTWTGLFALAFIAQFFLFSLSESASLQQNSIVWLIYVALAAKLSMRPKQIVPVRPAPSLSRALAQLAAQS
ncbi:MAG: O-antigen ligase family protein [Pseudomonadota bacterium]